MNKYIYQLTVFLYQFSPFKKKICDIIKKNKFFSNKLYKDLKFEGAFDVNVSNFEKFKLIHFGGRIENETYWKGLFTTFEHEMGWLWIFLSKQSDVIIDVGANTGIYSLVAKTVHPSAKIFAFEPSKNTFHKLIQNVSLNGFDIQCYDKALSNNSGTFTFFDSFDTNQTSASMSDQMHQLWKNYEVNSYEVSTITGKDFILQAKIEKIDLIKIDVEMFEPQVIEGFEDVLFNHQPIIFIEVLSNEVAEKLNLLFKNQFAFYHLSDKEKIVKKNKLEMVPLKWNYVLCPLSKSRVFEKMIENYI